MIRSEAPDSPDEVCMSNTNSEDMAVVLEEAPGDSLTTALMRLPGRKRMDAILEREDAEAVVASLAPEDFYFTVQEVGPDDSFPILALGTVEQLDFLFDLSWWNRENVHPARALDWLDRLARANENKLIAWIYEVDFTLLVLLFKRWITASMAPEDIDPLEAVETLPKNTLDDIFYWECRYPQYEDLVKQILSLLFEVNHTFYQELMDHVIWALDADMEEEAYRLHGGRLEDHAIPDFYDALSVYAAMKPEELPKVSKVSEEPEESGRPAFALVAVPDDDLLHRALKRSADAALLDCVARELAALANKIVVADQVPPENPESLRSAAEKATATVNLGLDILADGNETLAGTLLREGYIEHVFRVGHGALMHLKSRIERLLAKGWLVDWPGGISALDGTWHDTAEAFLKKTPMFPPDPGAQESGFIRDRKNLARAMSVMETIEALGSVRRALDCDPAALSLELWEDGMVQGVEDVTLGVLVFTAAARSLAGGGFQVVPLRVSEWPETLLRLDADTMRKAVSEWLTGTLSDSGRLEAVMRYFEKLLADYAAEAASFCGTEPGDPAHVPFFLFRGN